MCFSAQRSYEGNVEAPAAARAFGHSVVVATLLPAGWMFADDVAIVISELVSEGVAAGAQSLEVDITVHYDHIEIDMARQVAVDVRVPSAREAVSVTRGIILDALTTDLSTVGLENGHIRTRATMRCDPRYTTKIDCRLRPIDS